MLVRDLGCMQYDFPSLRGYQYKHSSFVYTGRNSLHA
jgi:hypothetical protein